MKTVNESFLWNCWYAAAWENEIEDGKALARTFLEKPIVIFRGESGGYTALDNRCCHRAAPLSSGRIEGDCIRCMYHGMKYDTTGKCVEIPGQDKISDVHRVHSYPIVEKGHLLWIWMGDPERADENDIPHYEPLDDPNSTLSPLSSRWIVYPTGLSLPACTKTVIRLPITPRLRPSGQIPRWIAATRSPC
jgi:vanillate O-demethylase monooxygenase subunit